MNIEDIIKAIEQTKSHIIVNNLQALTQYTKPFQEVVLLGIDVYLRDLGYPCDFSGLLMLDPYEVQALIRGIGIGYVLPRIPNS